MAAPALKLRCQSKAGLQSLDGLLPTSTIADLLFAISKATAIPAPRLKVKIGFPPKALDLTDVHRSLSDLQVKSGDKITVDEDASVGAVKETSGSTPAQAQTSEGAAASDRWLQEQLAMNVKGILQRKVVPADNSCLFTAINAVMTDGSVNLDVAGELRQIIAGVVCSDPETYSDGFLGRPNDEYVSWIMNKDSWGGGIEVSILASYYQTEIAVVDCQTGRIDRFGEDQHFSERVFLLYDGVHYDPLVLEAPDGSGTVLQTRFDSGDQSIMNQALDIGNEAKSSGQFTNVSEFSLRCLICRAALKGQKEAQQHAISTGHSNFGECRP